MTKKTDSNLNAPLPVVAPGGTISQNVNPVDPTHEREDSLSQFRQELIEATCKYCRAGKPLINGYHEWETQDGDWHGRSRVECKRDVNITSAIMPLVASIVKAAYEEAAQRIRAKNNGIVALFAGVLEELAKEVESLPPESALLSAQMAELEARLVEAKWWQRFIGLAHYDYCDFGSTDGPRGDFCTCGLSKRQTVTSRHIADLESQIAAVKAKLAKEAK